MYPEVEGYGVVSEGEKYHPTAFLDPAEEFKYAGDVEAQAAYQEENKDRAPEGETEVATNEADLDKVNSVVTTPGRPAEITDEQSNASEATSMVAVDEATTDGEPTVIETTHPEVVVTPGAEANEVTEGPVGTVTGESDTTKVEFE